VITLLARRMHRFQRPESPKVHRPAAADIAIAMIRLASPLDVEPIR
jgi:hypothetical protein